MKKKIYMLFKLTNLDSKNVGKRGQAVWLISLLGLVGVAPNGGKQICSIHLTLFTPGMLERVDR